MILDIRSELSQHNKSKAMHLWMIQLQQIKVEKSVAQPSNLELQLDKVLITYKKTLGLIIILL